MKYYIETFGCQQNKADSERIEAAFSARGMKPARSLKEANYVVINTCMVRQSAENRVYGLIGNLSKIKEEKTKKGETFKIIVTGCMVGAALRDQSGKYFLKIRKIMPQVDEFLPIEEVGFDNAPVRQSKEEAFVPISNGCNNFCTFCIVPFSRGREVSRPYPDIIQECSELRQKNYKRVTLLGQNVNSYGADLISRSNKIKTKEKEIKPVYVKHLGRYRIPTLFPYLLDEVAQMGFEELNFISSNPWDFSDQLIDVLAKNKNITRTLHLPLQSGSDNVLKRMNRWYTAEEYLKLISRVQEKVPGVKFTTDIIVGFCGETEKDFQDTVDLARKVGFEKAYIAMYTPRPLTASAKVFQDDIPYQTKKQRWQMLEELVNVIGLDKIKKSMV